MISSDRSSKSRKPYILVACICEHDDREDGKCGYGARPLDEMNFAAVCHGIPLEEMGQNEYNEIADGHQSYHTCVFKGIKTTKERQRNDNQPARNVSNSLDSGGDSPAEEQETHMNAVTQN